MFPWFRRYLYVLNLTKIGWVIKSFILLGTNRQKTEDKSIIYIRLEYWGAPLSSSYGGLFWGLWPLLWASIGTLIFELWQSLAEIWICACKNIMYMHASLCHIINSDRSGMFSWFHRYLHLLDPTQFGWYMGPSTQAHSMCAHKLMCSCHILCPERSSMFSWFHRYFDLSDLTQFGWDMGSCTQTQHACTLACVLRSYYVLKEVRHDLLIP